MVSLQPLGDQGVLATCLNEAGAARLAAGIRQRAPAGVLDVVQAYFTVGVFFDLEQTRFLSIKAVLEDLATASAGSVAPPPGKLHIIPCCYELELDLRRVAQHAGLPCSEVIRLHCQGDYTVYAIGFCPGFPYLGYLPDSLRGIPRLPSPRLRVEPGSVGLTGPQTGIYTEARPGGWNLIGRTPLELVNVLDGYFPLRTGDHVRFEAIDLPEYRQLAGKRLLR